jgi:methyl-accepting chemotaxis protein
VALFSFSSPIQGRAAASLQRRFLIGAGIAGVVVVLALAAAAAGLLERDIRIQGDARVADAATRAEIVVREALAARSREARALALSPEIIAATREGTRKAQSLSLPGNAIPALEERFAEQRSLAVSPAAQAYLRSLLPELEVAEILLTDANGFNAVITQRTSDFVQSDEGWWQSAWRDGLASADAAFDSSARQSTVSLAALVRDGTDKAGVLKLGFSAAPLIRSLATAGAGVRVDIVDSTDRILLSSDSTHVGQRLHGAGKIASEGGAAASFTTDSSTERAAIQRTNAGRWRVVAHLSTDAINAPFRVMRAALALGTIALLVVVIGLLVSMARFLQRRITTPTTELAEAAEAVAAGDFSVNVTRVSADDEIGRLSRAVAAMIVELRRLAGTIATSASETRAMSAEISAGTEEMAASAGEIANTASDLSAQASSMAQGVTAVAQASASLRDLAMTLDAGARGGVARNETLRTLAIENRGELDASARMLGALAEEVQASANAVATLGSASEEIRGFVTLVRMLARQSKLLALNAAMEAARAGEHGKGFAVVAGEVRRLAAMSSEAAERTEATVKGVLGGIERSRESAERAVETAAAVRDTATKASASFAHIEGAVAESESWTSNIKQASEATSALVSEIDERLAAIAAGTETFAAAMEEVAASSQEQSASTEEMAAAASTLGAAADRLSKLVAGLKTV